MLQVFNTCNLKDSNKFIITTAISLALGITIGFFKANLLPPLLPVVFLLLMVMSIFWYSNHTSLYNSPWFGVILSLFFISLGCYSYQNTIPAFQQHHYLHTLTQKRHIVQLQIKEVLKPNTYNYKYRATIQALDRVFCQADISYLVSKDSLAKPLAIGSRLLVNEKIRPVTEPKNPYQFNYASY